MCAIPSRNSNKNKKEKKKNWKGNCKHFALYANSKSQAKAFCVNKQIFKRSLFLCYRNLLLGSSPFLTTNTTRECYQTYPDEYCVKITPFGNQSRFTGFFLKVFDLMTFSKHRRMIFLCKNGVILKLETTGNIFSSECNVSYPL